MNKKRIFITSDLHFCHNKPFLYEPRGFNTITEMNQTIIKNWNKIVQPQDTVFILGDLMLMDNFQGMKLLSQLNGKKKIIFGNHDTIARQSLYQQADAINQISVLGYATMLKYQGYHFYLSHYPTLTSNWDIDKPLKVRVINLCGHTHTQDKFLDMDKGLIYHVELDAHNCYPVLLDNIIADVKNFLNNRKEGE